VADIKKNKTEPGKKDDHDPGKNDATEQEKDSQKNKQRETGTLEHFDDFTLLIGHSSGTIEIQPVKNRRPDDQNNKPGDEIVWKKMRLSFWEKVRAKAKQIREPPSDTQKEEVV
jgi:hypothetical protein